MIPKKSIILSPYQFKKVTLEAYERDGYICQVCEQGTREQLVPHHIYPKGRLRLDVLDNILTACGLCHIPLHSGQLIISVDDLVQKYWERIERFLR